MNVSPDRVVTPFPAVDLILRHPLSQDAIVQYGRKQVTDAIRQTLADLRDKHLYTMLEAALPVSVPPVFIPVASAETIAARATCLLERQNMPSLRPVINLTGTVLHTNLGRAVLPEVAIQAVVVAMRQPVNLEYDIESGKRGERDDHVRGLICELTGAEDCVVVNNNAAAVLLVLSSLSAGKETIVSRGELIEIGGSFRIPDIMRRAGARLREVGTTNRTHANDYTDAISTRTAAIMKVHTSNYRIEGFTAEVTPQDLCAIAHKHNIPVIDDLGSGTLVNLAHYGLKAERTVQAALRDGADIVTFSTDKLLGGPQLGIIAGRKDLVRLCARNQLKRALRADKLRLAALAATLALYRDPDSLPQKLPTLRAFVRNREELQQMSMRLAVPLQAVLGPGWIVGCVDLRSQIGSGAMPLETLDSAGLAMTPADGSRGNALDQLAKRFRCLPMPVIGRISEGRFLLDLRCLEDEKIFLDQLGSLRNSVAKDRR
jgi:L-seryl-tRNA(Ser) seleniumtransferase